MVKAELPRHARMSEQQQRESRGGHHFPLLQKYLRVASDDTLTWRPPTGEGAVYSKDAAAFAAGTYGKVYRVRRQRGGSAPIPVALCLKETAHRADAEEEARGVALAMATASRGFVPALLVVRPQQLPAVLMMQYTMDLRVYVATYRPSPVAALAILARLADVAATCWEAGVVVCDIKLANVVVMIRSAAGTAREGPIDVRFCDLGGVRRLEDAHMMDTFPPPSQALDAYFGLRRSRREGAVVWQLGALLAGLLGREASLQQLDEHTVTSDRVLWALFDAVGIHSNRVLAAAMVADPAVDARVAAFFRDRAEAAMQWVLEPPAGADGEEMAHWVVLEAMLCQRGMGVREFADSVQRAWEGASR